VAASRLKKMFERQDTRVVITVTTITSLLYLKKVLKQIGSPYETAAFIDDATASVS
tara:strand:- start:600 stop:767 length:168 start_codon:yes stop_codon:yes gene_type:complete